MREYFLDLQAGIESFNTTPDNVEEQQNILQFKRDLIKALVNRVRINKRRELCVEIRLNLLAILEHTAKKILLQSSRSELIPVYTI